MDRSAIMRAVKGRDTTPELFVRKILRAFAPGYRLCRRDLPGAPDVAYIARKKAIFVHGCFWHGHPGCRRSKLPATNEQFWIQKLTRNQERDKAVVHALEQLGWKSLIVWECELRNTECIESKLMEFLAHAPQSERQ